MKTTKAVKKMTNKIIFGGLMKTTLLDFPGKVAATLFLPGCNMRCPFCHNASLVHGTCEAIPYDEVLTFLKKRAKVLDGVCITGGEPTLYGEMLIGLISEIKALGYLVKLDTNGTHPELVKRLMDLSLIDYVAMDIKTRITDTDYQNICRRPIDTEKILESVALLKEGRIAYEFRTTLVKQFHGENEICDIAKAISGADAYYLQHFVDSGELIDGDGLCEIPKAEAQRLAAIASKYVPTYVRGH